MAEKLCNSCAKHVLRMCSRCRPKISTPALVEALIENVRAGWRRVFLARPPHGYQQEWFQRNGWYQMRWHLHSVERSEQALLTLTDGVLPQVVVDQKQQAHTKLALHRLNGISWKIDGT